MKTKLKKDIELDLNNPKRNINETTGLHSWHPYYAGYSEAFVDSIISNFKTKKLILDPWAGSGTTKLSALKYNQPNIMVDINPAMAAYTASKDFRILKNKYFLDKVFYDLLSELDASSQYRINQNDPLLDYMPKNLISISRKYLDLLPLYEFKKIKFSSTINNAGYCDFLNPYEEFLKVVLLKTIRESILVNVRSKNPTWVKKSNLEEKIQKRSVIKNLKMNYESMLSDLSESSFRNGNMSLSATINNNFLEVDFYKNSVDCIITSPPYLTRIDYAVSTKPENLLLLKDIKKFNILRRNTIGTTVINHDYYNTDTPQWGKTCAIILGKIFQHPSYASKSYYHPNIYQYFDSMFESCLHLKSILKPQGECYFVVQNSFYKDININLAQIIVEMFDSIGLHGQIVKNFPVKKYMANINSNSRKYKKKIIESIIKVKR